MKSGEAHGSSPYHSLRLGRRPLSPLRSPAQTWAPSKGAQRPLIADQPLREPELLKGSGLLTGPQLPVLRAKGLTNDRTDD